jgi:hypothetical protein
VAATSSATDEAQFIFADDDGHLWHTIRHPDENWTEPGDVNRQFDIPGRVVSIAATSSASNEAQFLFTTEGGGLYHTIRGPDTHWSGLGDLTAHFGVDHISPVVAAASSATHQAQFVFATDGHLWHTIRGPDTHWSEPGDVNGQIHIHEAVRAVAAASSATNTVEFLFCYV